MKLSYLKLSLALIGTALLASGCISRRVEVRESAGAPAPTREVVVTAPAAPAATVIATPAPAVSASDTIVVQAPPTPQVEVSGVAPSAEHVWIAGHWTRRGDRWVWQSGRWEARPTATSVYVPGHWERKGDGFLWREGYWK